MREISASICLFWLLLVAVHDFKQRRAPNWLVLAGALLALAALAVGSNPFEISWHSSLIGAAAGFGFLLIFYVARLMGAGDVKFAAALGLWVGHAALFPIWVIGSILAAAHGLLWLLTQRWPLYPRLETLLFGQPARTDGTPPVRRIKFIPYAAYLSLATVVWMFWGRQNF